MVMSLSSRPLKPSLFITACHPVSLPLLRGSPHSQLSRATGVGIRDRHACIDARLVSTQADPDVFDEVHCELVKALVALIVVEQLSPDDDGLEASEISWPASVEYVCSFMHFG